MEVSSDARTSVYTDANKSRAKGLPESVDKTFGLHCFRTIKMIRMTRHYLKFSSKIRFGVDVFIGYE